MQAQPERGKQSQPEHRPQPVLWRQPCVDDTDAFLAAVRRSRNLHGRWVKAPSTAQAFAAYCARMAEPANRAYLLLDGSALTAGQRRYAQRQFAQAMPQQPADSNTSPGTDTPLPLVGVINLTNIVRGNFQSGYLGYYAFSSYDGRGWMRAGLQAVIRDAFTALRLHRLEANIQPENTASLALVQACGFQQEGYSPRYLKISGRWQDHCRWAILSDN